MRGFESGQERAGLVDAFLILAVGGGICDDSASGLHVSDAIFNDHGAQRDARVQITSKIHVQHASRVDAAACALQLFDDFHGANFGRTGNRAGRKQAISASKQSTSSRSRPRNVETICITWEKRSTVISCSTFTVP